MGLTLDTATPIQLGAVQSTLVRSKLTSDNPNAFYKLTLQSPSDLVVLLNELSSDANVSVLDSAGNQLELTGGVDVKSENTGTLSEYLNIRALTSSGDEYFASGTYYIKVSLATGNTTTTNFALTIKTDQQTTADLIWAPTNNAGADIVYQEMDGTVGRTAATIGDNQRGSLAATGDINNDGQSDVILTFLNRTNGVFYLQDGELSGTPAYLPAFIGANDKIVGTGDFNKDGKTDLVIQLGNSATQVWTLDNTDAGPVSGIPVNEPSAIPSTAKVIGVEDLNKDGSPDLVYALPSVPGRANVIFMDGFNKVAAVRQFNTPSLTDLNAKTGLGDFNNDGNVDLSISSSGSLKFDLLGPSQEFLGSTVGTGYSGYVALPIKKGTQTIYPEIPGNNVSNGVNIGILNGIFTVKESANKIWDSSDMYYFNLTGDESDITFNLTAPSTVGWKLRKGSPTGTIVDQGTGNETNLALTDLTRDRYFIILEDSSTPAANVQYTMSVELDDSRLAAPVTLDTELIGNAGSNPRNIIEIPIGYMFIADSDIYGTELFVYDFGSGTPYHPAGIIPIDLVPGAEGSNPSDLTWLSESVGNDGYAFFAATDANGDREPYAIPMESLWERIPKAFKIDINSNGSSNPTNFNSKVVSNAVVIAAETQATGVEPWVIKGQLESVSKSAAPEFKLLADVNSGSASSFPENFVLNNEVVFIAESSQHGRELFRVASSFATDTTPQVINFNPETTGVVNSSNPQELIDAGVYGLYAIATSAADGTEVFRIKPDWTTVALNIQSGATSSNPTELSNSGSPDVLFAADSPSNGRELYRIDLPTDPEVADLIDIRSGATSSNPQNLYTTQDWLNSYDYYTYFSADLGSDNYEVHRILAGTSTVSTVGSEINSSGSADPYGFRYDNSTGDIVFSASDTSDGKNFELWHTNIDTNSNPSELEIRAAVGSLNFGSNPAGSSLDSVWFSDQFHDYILLNATTREYGSEPWLVDTSTWTATRIADINQASTGGGFQDVITIDGQDYYIGPAEQGTAIFNSSGQVAFASGSDTVFDPSNLIPVSADLAVGVGYFEGYGYELFRIDASGTTPSLTRLTDIEPGEGSSSIDNFAELDGTLYFSAYASDGDHEGNTLWKVSASGSPTKIRTFSSEPDEPISQVLALKDGDSGAPEVEKVLVIDSANPNEIEALDVVGNTWSTWSFREPEGMTQFGGGFPVNDSSIANYYARGNSAYGAFPGEILAISTGTLENWVTANAAGEVYEGMVPLVSANGILYQAANGDVTNLKNVYTLKETDEEPNIKFAPERAVYPFYNDFAVYRSAVYGGGFAFAAKDDGGVNKLVAEGWEPFGLHFGLAPDPNKPPKNDTDDNNGGGGGGNNNTAAPYDGIGPVPFPPYSGDPANDPLPPDYTQPSTSIGESNQWYYLTGVTKTTCVTTYLDPAYQTPFYINLTKPYETQSVIAPRMVRGPFNTVFSDNYPLTSSDGGYYVGLTLGGAGTLALSTKALTGNSWSNGVCYSSASISLVPVSNTNPANPQFTSGDPIFIAPPTYPGDLPPNFPRFNTPTDSQPFGYGPGGSGDGDPDGNGGEKPPKPVSGIVNPASYLAEQSAKTHFKGLGAEVPPAGFPHVSDLNASEDAEGNAMGSGAHNFFSLNNGMVTFLADNGSGLEQLFVIIDNQTGRADTTGYSIAQITSDFYSFADMEASSSDEGGLLYFIGKSSESAEWQVYSSDGGAVVQRTSLTSGQIPFNLQVKGEKAYYNVFNESNRQVTVESLG